MEAILRYGVCKVNSDITWLTFLKDHFALRIGGEEGQELI